MEAASLGTSQGEVGDAIIHFSSMVACLCFIMTYIGAVNESWSKRRFILFLYLKFYIHINTEVLADGGLWRLQLIPYISILKECFWNTSFSERKSCLIGAFALLMTYVGFLFMKYIYIAVLQLCLCSGCIFEMKVISLSVWPHIVLAHYAASQCWLLVNAINLWWKIMYYMSFRSHS